MADLVKFIEYLGDKEKKEYYDSENNEKVVFDSNDDFGGRKVAVCDVRVATELLRFPNVFREINVREIGGKEDKGGDQADMLEKETSSDVADSTDKGNPKGKKK